ncbi:MAG: glycosyltransferase [Flavobacteriales bacterium]|nr:glycosyltransferase [Crocinitomicaceae bacterium]NBX79941.1 glycosyltransferase [Flavobacteriales bacterium]
MRYELINNIRTYSPSSREELMNFALQEKKILIAVNAEKILHSTPEMQEIINNNIGYPDGIGAVWALNKKGVDNVVKIPGCELWLDIVKKHAASKSFYLIGGKQEVIDETVSKLKSEFPLIDIKGYRNGYIKTNQEKEALKKELIEKKPDFVFVAMGSPKQEQLMEEFMNIHSAVYQGLGGSFDVYTGNVVRAPKWWIDKNLEWAYRLVKQPTRIKRQLPLIKFYFLLKFNKF